MKKISKEREKKVIEDLEGILDDFEPNLEPGDDYIDEPTMFWLISNYNSAGNNKESIGGSWVCENGSEKLKNLPA